MTEAEATTDTTPDDADGEDHERDFPWSFPLPKGFDRRLERTFQVLVVLAISVVALQALQAIFKPLFLALLIFFLLRPVVRRLHESNMPTPAAYALAISGVVLLMVVAGWMVTLQVQSLEERLPFYESRLENLSADAEEFQILGWSPNVTGIEQQLSSQESQELMLSYGRDVADGLVTAGTVVFFLVFIALEASYLPRRLAKVYSPEVMERIREVSARAEEGINQYLVIKTLVSLGTGTTSALIMLFFGIDLWFLWGFLTFALNYVPYIGSIIATVPPALLSFVILDPGMALLMIALLIGNQQLFGSVIEPQFTGKRLDISPLVLLLVVAFWSWMWGLTGMILAVPLAMITKIILLSMEQTRPLGLLMAADVSEEE